MTVKIPFEHEGGIRAFVEHLNRQQDAAARQMSSISAERTASVSKWHCSGTSRTQESIFAFTNNIPQRDGGTHLAGMRAALTRTLNGYIEQEGLAKKQKVSTSR